MSPFTFNGKPAVGLEPKVKVSRKGSQPGQFGNDSIA